MTFGRFIILTVLFAALQAGAAIELGGLGGLSMASASVSAPQGFNSPNLNGRTGLAFGVTSVLPFGEYFGIQPELLYVQKGASRELGVFEGTNQKAEVTANLSYLELPILAKGRFGNKTIRGTALFGPALGLKMSASETVTNQPSTPINNANGIDFSLYFGAGAEMNITKDAILFLDGRYMMGLLNVLDEGPNANTSTKSRAFLLLSGARFKI